MRFLLDTHAFLWTISGSSNIPQSTRSAIVDPANEVFVSAVSLWEIAIKVRRGKLDLGSIGPEDLVGLAEEMGFELIGLAPEEATSYGRLGEDSHFDPFDRMLVWQAIERKLTMISKDAEFGRFVPFGLALLWK